MSARDNILARVRQRAARAGGEDRKAAVAARLGAKAQTAPRPTQSLTDGETRLAQFEAKARAADATVSRVARMSDLPAALAEELRGRNLAPRVRMGDDPALRTGDWSALEVSHGPGRIEEPATVSVAPFAVAETGTLALMSGPDNPVTLTFLGETHFVAVRANDVVAGYEDLWAAFRTSGRDPRTVNLVTGPSRSADIGQTLQLGAHGPVSLHIFVVDEDDTAK